MTKLGTAPLAPAAALALALLACAGNAPSTAPPENSPTDDPAVPAPQPPPPAPDLADQTRLVGDHLAAGEVTKMLAMTAPTLETDLSIGCGEDDDEQPPEKETLVGADAQRAWYAKAATWWAPACAQNDAEGCRWFNSLTLAGEPSCANNCCDISGPAMHNTPFLTEVCFADGLVTVIKIVDGC